MKAFFTTFARRGSASNENESAAGANGTSATLRRPNQNRSVTQTSFRSTDSSARDIGYMPSGRASPSEKALTTEHASAWTSKVSQGLKGSLSMRKKGKMAGPSSFRANGTAPLESTVAEPRPSVAASDDLDPRTSRLNLAKLKYPPSASRSGYLDSTSNEVTSRSQSSLDRSPKLTSSKRMSAMDSAELANRLNELAVANADGLLDEDEYRTLRTAVFDRMMRTDGAATSSNLVGISGSHQPAPAADAESRSSWEYLEQLPDSTQPSAANGVPKYARRGSIAALSMARPFSRESRRSVSEEIASPLHRRGSVGASSLLSNGEEGSRRPMSTRTYQSSQASRFGRMRSGSHRRAQAELAAKDMERTFSAERTARSLRAVSIHDSSTRALTADVRDARAETGASFGAEYADRSTAEIKAEIAVVKKEGDGMLETFALMEETLKHRQPGRRPLQSIDTNADDTAAFEHELADIQGKRGAVVKRYEDRLSYLQSKLRSAAIREGLK